MPNYRQKNRNRNKNKNRNKQQQQQQQQQQKTEKTSKQEESVEKSEPQTATTNIKAEEVKVENYNEKEQEQVVSIENVDVLKSSSTALLVKQGNDIQIGNVSNDEQSTQEQQEDEAAQKTTTKQNVEEEDKQQKIKTTIDETKNVAHYEKQQQNEGNNELNEITSKEKTTNNCDDDEKKNENTKMGTKNSKSEVKETEKENGFSKELQTKSSNNVEVEKEGLEFEQLEENDAEKALKLNQAKVIIHRIVNETQPQCSPQRLPSPDIERQININAQNNNNNQKVKVIFHRIQLEEENNDSDEYQVHSPTNEFDKLTNKSRASTNLLIQELSDNDGLSDYNDNTPLVSEVESETESTTTTTTTTTTTKSSEAASTTTTKTEKGDTDVAEIVVTTTSTTYQPQQEQDDLRTRRVQKRAALENHFLPQLLSPRYLDCIIEENSDLSDARSDSNSSIPGQQQQSSSTPQTPETPTGGISRRAMAADVRFPKSQLDFSRKHKHGQLPKSPTMPGAICEEPQFFIVETKEIAEPTQSATGTLESATIEKATTEAAEVVFIDSASSSMSDLLEELHSNANEFEAADADVDEADISEVDDSTLSALDLDTDSSDLMSYTGRNSSGATSDCTLTGGSREQTPVNQINEPPVFSNATTKTETNEANRTTNEETEQPNEMRNLNDNSDDNAERQSYTSSTTNMRNRNENENEIDTNIDKFEGNDRFNFECSAILKQEKEQNSTKMPNKKSFNEISTMSNKNFNLNANTANNADACVSFALPAAVENIVVDSQTLFETLEAEMNNVRDVLNSLDNDLNNTPPHSVTITKSVKFNEPLETTTIIASTSIGKATPPIAPPRKYQIDLENRNNVLRRDANSQSPPPLPPPPTYLELENNHYNNTNINTTTTTTTTSKTNDNAFTTKTLQSSPSSLSSEQAHETQIELPTMPSATGALPQPPLSPSTTSNPFNKLANMVRQESADSFCSDSTVNSQCTTINLGASPKNSFDYNFDGDEMMKSSTHLNVSDASITPTKTTTTATATAESPQPIKKLRHLCTETLASMPYGEDVLVELANVSQNISEAHKQLTIFDDFNQIDSKMPYPLPDMPVIEQLQVKNAIGEVSIKPKRPAPPPPSTHSSTLNQHQNDSSWLGMPTATDPKLLVCLSPAQRAYIEAQKQQQPADELLDAHQKYIDRRGYHELSKAQVRAINDEKKQEQQILETAAIMRKLRKSITPPPPPVPPPPVPVKSSETAAKAQQLNEKNQKQMTKAVPVSQNFYDEGTVTMNLRKNDASVKNANEQQHQHHQTFDPTTSFTVGEQHQQQQQNNNTKHRLLAIIHDDTTDEITNTNDEFLNRTTKQEFAKTSTSSASTSACENNSRQTSMKESTKEISSQQAPFQYSDQIQQHQQQPQQPFENQQQTIIERIHFPTQNQQQTHSQQPQLNIEMQSMESDLARMFPTMGSKNIFDANPKRFSNIETFSQTAPFGTDFGDFSNLNTQPKRYSNIETHSYETKKRIENGKVIYDYTDTKHESHKDGDEQLKTRFPIKAENTKQPFPVTNVSSAPTATSQHDVQQKEQQQQELTSTSASHVGEIMSALKLNTAEKCETDEASKAAAAPQTAQPMLSTNGNTPLFTNVTTTTKTNTEHKTSHAEKEESKVNQTPTLNYEEFRQRAKAAADAIFAAANAAENQPQSQQQQSNEKQQQQQQPSTFRRSFDHEKLFKDFDELSNQLKAELDAGKQQRAEREKSASLYDLSRMQMQFNNDEFRNLKESRHEHMQELEREIERSMRSRQSKQRQLSQEPATVVREIPIKIENGHDTTDATAQPSNVHNIPIRLEAQSPYQVTSPVPTIDYASDSHSHYYNDQSNRSYRRAESMYNLPTEQRSQHQHQQYQKYTQAPTAPHQRERSYSAQYETTTSGHETADDWSRYVSDLGSSENITRPFAREVEICYQSQRQPRTIRAPRLTVSTNDLSNNYLSAQTYDSFNAYNVRRTHAPMMSPVSPMPPPQQKTKPQYLSCYSLLERDPNPTYIGTTSRRGVSPAPVSPQPPHAHEQQHHFSVSEHEMRQRRASLPRELQEQQLKYIQSKEQELKTEFERLQNERQRLLDEMRNELGVQPPPKAPATAATPMSPPLVQHPPITPPPRHAYRPVPPRRLPTLSEDEVFRQQMAEEWLNKIAEREERRLQKIIKVSKAHEIEHNVRHVPVELSNSASNITSGVTPDIGSEFLRRVKERRTKLAMPADSDWESGAESQPQPTTAAVGGNASETEDLPTLKIYDGKSAPANLQQLPKHLREFAKFSNHQTEKIEGGGERQLHQEEERRQEATDNSFSSASKKTSVMKTFKITRQHPYQQQQQLQDGGVNKTLQNFATTQQQQTNQPHQGDQHANFLPPNPRSNFYNKHRKQKFFNLKKPTRILNERISQRSSDSYGNCQTKSLYEICTDTSTKIKTKTTTTATSTMQSERKSNEFRNNNNNYSNIYTYNNNKNNQSPSLLTSTNSKTNRRSWSESNLLKEIDKELKLAKGFLFANGIWTPTSSLNNLNNDDNYNNTTAPTPPPPPPARPFWTPQPSPTIAAGARKEFRPVRFESPTLPRRYVLQQPENSRQSTPSVPLPPWSTANAADEQSSSYALPSPRSVNSCTNLSTTTAGSIGSYGYGGADTCQESVNFNGYRPTRGVSDKIRTFERSTSNQELTRPFQRRQPTNEPSRPGYRPNEVIYKVKNEYMSEPETEYERPRKMAQLRRVSYDGIGPVTKDGMPIILRSEVKQPHQHEWYKRLYQTIHKQKNGDDYVIRYKCPRGRYPYKTSGYQSEPEPNYDSDYSIVKYKTGGDRRRLQSVSSAANVRDEKLYGTMPNSVRSTQTSSSVYNNQPGRIENYITGQNSTVAEKEKKDWWDEVMDIFNGHLGQTKLSPHYTEGNLSRALAKETGYTSDSNLVFRKNEPLPRCPLSPIEQKQAYKSLQSGGEPPLLGFRKPAPEKPKDQDYAPPVPPQTYANSQPGNNPTINLNGNRRSESPNRYFESDVNIHFKTPVRHEFKEPIPEAEIAARQAEQMQKLYQEERRRKYLQELQDMNSRRHTDNFTPSQKSPIPLNRYDDFPAPKSPNLKARTVARALYNFQGQGARELSFRKGDIIYLRRQIDKNWYEGEHNAMVGLLPANYIEIINRDAVRPQLKKPSEGQARAKYNFQAQSGVELSLNKGELVTLTRRVDENWFEGKIANRKGIFPVSYVEVLVDIGADDQEAKTIITDYSTTNLRPSLDVLRTNINNEFNIITQNGQQPPNGILKGVQHKTEALHVDTNSEPITYRALYKYRPQNSDELELLEGDLVHVLEKCDDGWFVGTSQRTGCFGTFPGNYVERV